MRACVCLLIELGVLKGLRGVCVPVFLQYTCGNEEEVDCVCTVAGVCLM